MSLAMLSVPGIEQMSQSRVNLLALVCYFGKYLAPLNRLHHSQRHAGRLELAQYKTGHRMAQAGDVVELLPQ